MRSVQLQVEDDNYESFLTVIKSLKEGMVKNFSVKESDAVNKDFEQTKVYFHKCLSDIENGNTQLLSQEQYTNQMNDFKENLKSKYANN
ncbi:MAG: hypothetical protein WC279_05935 [Sulfurimonas sp.]|jgi:hypothetical protein|uniref:hypothetical protein n=1 Tax=Sulfurimonas sp. TaxID=2022749 RepID=UPI001BC30360|nr:hypothetical protein [Sulfurimonas sp.]